MEDNGRKRRPPDDDLQDTKRSRYEEILASLDLDNINWAQDEPREGDSPWVDLHGVQWSQSFTQETAEEEEGRDIEWSQLTPFTQEVSGGRGRRRSVESAYSIYPGVPGHAGPGDR
ncbi:PREDICTED: uncharacterized protein LOC109474205 [Branchiostoma belcheri]|uniref:Uncharacterized protein LOC109474205 n=1 Tax=Branchiostoma belcheri TaxID=7741 RepID=A0A6P4ZK64_BRABE|nr:PREDICTED: uncharacterized protein LOC109474205 [Branchiostoma belcheri]